MESNFSKPMNKSPLTISENMTAAKALSICSDKKIYITISGVEKDSIKKSKNLLGIILFTSLQTE